MSGAYTHLTVANEARAKARKAGLRNGTLSALGSNLKFVELGAVSPDYPYLSTDRTQGKWADFMHYTQTSTLIRSAVSAVHRAPAEAQPKLTAWLFGFVSHIVTDMTIHPVVELKVGPYKGNETAHRICEMHQDAHIFPRMNMGAAAHSRHLESGLATCNALNDDDAIDPEVERVWLEMFRAAYPDQISNNSPQPSSWHRGFRRVLSAMATANHLFPFARHVGAIYGLTYPQAHEIDLQYVKRLKTPEGLTDLDLLFERALGNVVETWRGLDEALATGRSDALDKLEDWNLDTGRSLTTGQLVFWGSA